MAGDLPEPLVPLDLDLRDFRWMKLDLIALFNSDFNSTADDTAWRAGVTLWGKAWHQVPAGSLPDDDARLCNLAGLGRDTKTWKRVREEAMHGFVRCADGRLYHRFLCAMAVEAAEERDRYARRRQADRERKATRISAGIPPDERETGPPIPAENGDIPAEKSQFPAEFHPENLIEGAKRRLRIHKPTNLKPSGSDSVSAQYQVEVNGVNPKDRRFAPPKQAGVRENIKEQLRQKLMRFCNARLRDGECSRAIAGLMGDDPEHDAQWWFDEIDARRKRSGWDDTREWKRRNLQAAQ